ncbi:MULTISPECIES: permease prefix domain 1-containing protein [Microbacterium]|uniref:permease prefix domain 1-containing protein n=1 Tax=Microbacterium TaxID=33882 RepID=UPI0021A7C27B|nr:MULTISPECIES: permease prefix domain 1-containing protein [Microbacterium]MCT1364333.1 permease prefix domain 1-containing protein [Microbacterium sp. p3-SID131]MCT1376341.1 permease prefix domain 1-containing protein [Microbacterium sp. p3-SID337]MCZ0710398.1 permease prefix domain 1-containing protein [Microbacterium paraoxydans]
MTTSTLTERYISATIRSLAPEAQDEVRAELEAAIADAVDARREQGESPEEAERAVLTDLGDPGILAAGYADRPLHLIGPRYYLTWWRLLKLLLFIVPPFAAVGVAIGQLINGADPGEVIGAVVSVMLSVIVHLCFWVTLVFVVLERTGADTGVRWDVDQLPEPTEHGAARADVIASLVFLLAGIGAIVWDATLGFFPTGGDPIPILAPALWPVGIGVLLALMIAEAGLAVAVYARRRWTVAAAVVNTVLAVAFAVWALTLLLRGELLNPAFLEFVFTGNGVDADTMRVLTVITGVCLVAFPAWDIVDGWMKTARARGIG